MATEKNKVHKCQMHKEKYRKKESATCSNESNVRKVGRKLVGNISNIEKFLIQVR